MKLSVEGTQEEIKEILSTIRISQEDNKPINLDGLNGVKINLNGLEGIIRKL
ncbi:hypothetical protein [Enterococcus mundtii]|uniref:Uncharacterized protein n=1 Tax=Enterococcus mundtii TaxID=53346 RepID=A0A848MYL2_ENTMU|nr:hypothetical protein [Enterococcus mundtii]NMP59065.1 hypothetical protein [Enterococcus mundtii]